MRFLVVLLFLAATTVGSFAEAPRKVSWTDLGSGLAFAENPFYGLSSDEAMLVGVLVDTADLRKSDKRLSSYEQKREEIALAALESVGIDGRAKVSEIAAYGKKLKRSKTALNRDLLEQFVEVPGFVLPLKHKDGVVTEFILVPYAGSCIHTPPPPGNQMIVVQAPEGFKLNGLFEPVVVSGRLAESGESRSVGLSDGEAEFDIGYAMTAERVQSF